MFLPLTDILACPQCEPRAGLVLFADRTRERRVLEGWLGCPRCETRYPIHDGFADLRRSERRAAPPPAPAPDEDRDAATRLAALMGVGQGRSYALLVGPAARHAPAIAALVEGVEVVTLEAALAGWDEEAGTSRLAAESLPFFDRALRGVTLSGPAAEALIEEAGRVLNPMGRLVIEGAPADVAERLEAAGLRLLAEEGGTAVAAYG